LEEGHAFGPMIDIMEVVHIAKKGRILDTLEKYYIYREHRAGVKSMINSWYRKIRYLRL